MNRRRQRRTFNGILSQVASQNERRLMERARAANYIAKSVSGKARKYAYWVKTNALINLCRKFPERVFISSDPRTPNHVLVRNVTARFGLHAPIYHFRRTDNDATSYHN